MKTKTSKRAPIARPRRSAVSHAVRTQIQSKRNHYVAAAIVSRALVVPQQAPAQELVLEEIIVTATKRADNLQDIPISVIALSSQTIEQLGIDDFDSYALRFLEDAFDGRISYDEAVRQIDANLERIGWSPSEIENPG